MWHGLFQSLSSPVMGCCAPSLDVQYLSGWGLCRGFTQSTIRHPAPLAPTNPQPKESTGRLVPIDFGYSFGTALIVGSGQGLKLGCAESTLLCVWPKCPGCYEAKDSQGRGVAWRGACPPWSKRGRAMYEGPSCSVRYTRTQW
jgi:hypothetical protein